jgi:transcriptional accessory protein Tex/SPT6
MTGKLVETATVFPHELQHRTVRCIPLAAVRKHGVNLIAIGESIMAGP